MTDPKSQPPVDLSKLSPDEQRIYRLYGKLPSTSDLLANRLKERKYFDSGDYALSQAGKLSQIPGLATGSQHPSPEKIPRFHPGRAGSIAGPQLKSPRASISPESALPLVPSHLISGDGNTETAEDDSQEKQRRG